MPDTHQDLSGSINCGFVTSFPVRSLSAVLALAVLCLLVPCGASAVSIDYADYFHWVGLVETVDDGSYEEITRAGDHLYAARLEGGLQILSVVDPLAPVVVADFPTAGEVRDVAVDGPVAYVAAGSAGLLVVDVSDPADPDLLGSALMSDEAQGVAVDGTLVFVACGEAGVFVMDVSDPENPVVDDFLETTGNARRVALWGEHLVVADGFRGVEIAERDPYVVIRTVGTDGQAWSVHPAGDYLYVADYDAGLAVVDASTIAEAEVVGILRSSPAVIDVSAVGDIVVMTSLYGGVVTVDVSNPEAPTEIARLINQTSAYGLALDGQHIHVAAEECLYTYRLGNSEVAPVYGALELNVPRSVAADRRYVYAVDFARLSVVEPYNNETVGMTATLFDPRDIRVAGDYAYIADAGVGLRVADISRSYDPVLSLGMYLGGEARGLTLDGERLYMVVEGMGLVVLSLEADAGSPAWMGVGGTPGQARDVVAREGVAYVADGTGGLYLFDVSGDGDPPLLGFLATGHDLSHVAVDGDHAFAVGENMLLAFDVSDPDDIWVTSSLRLQGPLCGIEAFDGVVYVIDPFIGLYVIDVSDPSTLRVIGGGLEGAYLVRELSYANERLYIVDNRGVFLMPVHGIPTGVDDGPDGPGPVPPSRFRDVAVAPNPFNPSTTVTFSLAAPGDVRAGVYDLSGGLVDVLADRRFAAGDHALQWSGRDATGRPMPSGVYVIRLGAGEDVRSEKLMLVR